MKRISRDRYLLVLLGAYLIASLTYAILIPWGENPDETAHYEFVQYLAQKGHLPVFSSSDLGYEAHQPPLYYALALPFFWLSQLLGTPKAIRFLALLTGAGVVAFTYLTARRAYPSDQSPGLLGGAIAAFLPSQLAANSSVGNDSLATLMFSVFSFWAVGLWKRRMGMKEALGVGVFVGLALLTKLTCLLIAPLAVAAILVSWERDSGAKKPRRRSTQHGARRRERSKRSVVRGTRFVPGKRGGFRLAVTLVVVGATALVICGWWMVRNQVLYGDPMASRFFMQAFERHAATPDFFLSRGLSFSGYLLLVGWFTFRTFWGSFGRADIRAGYTFLPGWVYWFWLGVSVCVLVGWIRRARGAEARDEERRGLKFGRWFLLLQIVFILAFFLRLNMAFFQGQARYLLPVVTPIAIFLGLGLLGVFPERWRTRAALALSVAFFAYSLSALLIWGLPAYAGVG